MLTEDRKLVLRQAAPFAQHPNGVLVSRQPIHNSLWQHNLETGRDLLRARCARRELS